jgi:hypothetical protein
VHTKIEMKQAVRSADTRTKSVPSMPGTINYIRPIGERLHIDVRDFSRTNMQFESHDLRVEDARRSPEPVSLDRQGFALARHRSAVATSRDVEVLMRDYHAEMAAFVRDVVGARDVLPQRTGMLLRFGERSAERGVKPARFAHLDYTTAWAHRFVDLVKGWERFEPALYSRFAIYQTWRATSPAPQDNTLALCDGRTVRSEHTVEFDVTIGPEDVPGNTFVARVCRYDAAHRWHYFPNLAQDEVIVFKAFDSAAPDALNVLHSAFDDPQALPDAVPRSSIEARFVAFFD